MHVGQHAFRLKQRKTAIVSLSQGRPFDAARKAVNRQLHDGLLSPTALSAIGDHCAIQIALKHELQFRVSHSSHIRHRSSCLICTLPTADNDVGSHSSKQDVG